MCLQDGAFSPKRNEHCQECPLFKGFNVLALSVLPRSAIVAGLKTIGRLMIEDPMRPPGFCGFVWEHDQHKQKLAAA